MRADTAYRVALWMPRLLSVLRIVAALLFIEHGTQKLFGFPVPPPAPVHVGTLLGTAGLIEITGGTLLLLGLLTRPVAFILSGEMATAFFMQHLPRGLWPLANGGELAVLYCFLFLFIVAAGPGVWSVDALIRSARANRSVHGSTFVVHGSRP